MGNSFWDNKANEFGNRNSQQPNNPPPNRPPNNDSWNQNQGGGNQGNNNVPPWGGGNSGNNNVPPWGGGGGGNANTQAPNAPSGALAKTFMSSVFTYMSAALVVTAITSLIVASSTTLMETFFSGPLHWVLMFSPLIMLFVMMGRFHKMSPTTMMACYFVFAILMGASMAWIFHYYSMGSIVGTFFITAGTFGVMAFLGYTTNVDLTRFGGILIMALIGVVIAMVVNMFMQSGPLDYLISILGVLIFTGLTAYDVQKLKRIGQGLQYGGGTTQKLAMMGAVTLYLDFINLFMFLLRLFGGRD